MYNSWSMTVDFKELHQSRLRNHPPSLHTVSFPPSLTLRYYSHPGLEIGSVLWTGGTVLCQYILDNPATVAHKQVLELGSGLGITGIVAARYAATVHLTDKRDLVPLISANLRENDCCNGAAFEYVWGAPQPREMSDTYDVILGADVLYSEEGYPGLKRTIIERRGVGGSVVLTYKERGMGERRFLGELKREFPVCREVTVGDVNVVWLGTE